MLWKITAFIVVIALSIAGMSLLYGRLKAVKAEAEILKVKVEALEKTAKQLETNIKAIKVQEKETKIVHVQARKIEEKIEAAKNETDYVAIRNDLVDLFNGVSPGTNNTGTDILSIPVQAGATESRDSDRTIAP